MRGPRRWSSRPWAPAARDACWVAVVGFATFAWRRSQEVAAEARDLAAAEQRLAETTERYRSLFEYHSHAIFALDLEGRFVAANRASEQLSGYTEAELRERSITDLADGEDALAALQAFSRALEKEAVRVELRIRQATGRVVELDVTGLPIVVGGEVVGVHGIAEDVTERNRLQRDLVRSEQAAVRANQAKSLFVANVSHEIRTPLTSMLAVTELLAGGPLDEESERFVRILDRSGRRLVRLVDDLLDFARMEAGVVTLDEAELDLAVVLDEAVGTVEAGAAEKGLELTVELDPALPPVLRGDAHRVTQVLVNLLGNAVKFTADGSVTVSATLSEERPGAVVVLLRVTDTGIGMSAEQRERLFEPFSQADDSIARTYGGTGLGLAICKHLVQLMGGSIWVTSALERGSTFSVLLPLRTA